MLKYPVPKKTIAALERLQRAITEYLDVVREPVDEQHRHNEDQDDSMFMKGTRDMAKDMTEQLFHTRLEEELKRRRDDDEDLSKPKRARVIDLCPVDLTQSDDDDDFELVLNICKQCSGGPLMHTCTKCNGRSARVEEENEEELLLPPHDAATCWGCTACDTVPYDD